MKGQLWLGEIQMRKPKWEQQKNSARDTNKTIKTQEQLIYTRYTRYNKKITVTSAWDTNETIKWENTKPPASDELNNKRDT